MDPQKIDWNSVTDAKSPRKASPGMLEARHVETELQQAGGATLGESRAGIETMGRRIAPPEAGNAQVMEEGAKKGNGNRQHRQEGKAAMAGAPKHILGNMQALEKNMIARFETKVHIRRTTARTDSRSQSLYGYGPLSPTPVNVEDFPERPRTENDAS